MNENDNHLPVYGVGPFLVAPIVIISVIGLILTLYKMIPILQLDYLNWAFIVLGIIIIISGALFWISAVKSDIQDKIKSNRLVTTGVYGLIRHPIYAAFLYLSTGLILISSNIYLFFLPILYCACLSYALKNTEEKWLFDLYGDDYIKYSKEVNRFVPKVK